MKIYRCKQLMFLAKYDDEGFLIANKSIKVEVGEEFELSGDKSRIIGGTVHLNRVDGKRWLEMDEKTFEEYFEEVDES